MALSTSDIQALQAKGLNFVTVNAAGVITEAHSSFKKAQKAGGHPLASVAKAASNGTTTAVPNSDAHLKNFGKAR
jgi:hypothetical protein